MSEIDFCYAILLERILILKINLYISVSFYFPLAEHAGLVGPLLSFETRR